jgi:glycerol-3-phosphate acyltransferase PlsY
VFCCESVLFACLPHLLSIYQPTIYLCIYLCISVCLSLANLCRFTAVLPKSSHPFCLVPCTFYPGKECEFSLNVVASKLVELCPSSTEHQREVSTVGWYLCVIVLYRVRKNVKRVQEFKSSRVQEFKSSRVQERARRV